MPLWQRFARILNLPQYVSIEGARHDYGVAILGDPVHDPEGLRIDQAETRRLRAKRS